ncbi:MAG: hypothetical protein WC593_01955 [Methanoregula sp.]
MRDTGCPPFLEVLSCLSCILLSLAMIGWLLLWLSAWNVQVISLEVWVFFLAFGVIVVYSFMRLIRGLFPLWLRAGPGGSVMVKVLEIDAVGE